MPKMANGKMRFSPTGLNLFLECPKCFWLEHVKGIKRPRGIFPSLPGGMDLLIKKYFDKYRALGKLPPELVGKIDCDLFPDNQLLDQWRGWRTALVLEDKESGAVLSGMLDDLGLKRFDKNKSFARPDLQSKSGLGHQMEFVPLDYKTRGFDVKEGGESFYFNQLNCYALLLRENGMPPAGHAYLIYYIPKDVAELGMTRFDVVPKRVEVNADTALETMRGAVKLLAGPMPETNQCEYCAWANNFIKDEGAPMKGGTLGI